MRHQIKRHPILAMGFTLALVFTVFFALRLVMMALFWPPNPGAPIEGWMTVAYVAQANAIPREVVAEAIGIAPSTHPRRSLTRIAQERGESLEEIITRLNVAIAAAQGHADD